MSEQTMSREKQIEEMHELSESIYMSGHGLEWKDSDDIAEQLYNAGFRKQSEVAREIFEEIEKVIGNKYEYYVFDNMDIEGVEQDAIITFADTMKRHFDELKKKYNVEKK